MQFTLCENTGFFLRMGLVGPSGSGKTYTALKVATELGFQKVGILDTENRSARRYARAFSRRFVALELEHFSPRDYIAGIQTAVDAGIEVLVIDSLSHAWMGKGGVLEMVDQSTRRQSRGGSGSSFNGWREVTPEHNKLVEALVHAPLHLIVTMRVKTDYIVEKDDKGKSVPRKVGLAPVQREGLEYEFDVIAEISPEHEAVITKSRCPDLSDQVLPRPGGELARTLRAWLDGGGGGGPPEERPWTPTTSAAPTGTLTTTSPTTTRAAAPTAGAPGAPSGGSATSATTTTTATDPDADSDWRGRRCDDCSAPVVLLATEAGQPVLVRPQRRDRADQVDEREVYDLRCHVPHGPSCPARPRPAPAQPPRQGDPVADQAALIPWLEKIDGARTLETLEEVREELNQKLKRRTQAQGETLRRALEAARTRSRSALRDATQTALPGTATAGPPARELRVERDPADPDGYTTDDQPIGLVPTDHL